MPTSSTERLRPEGPITSLEADPRRGSSVRIQVGGALEHGAAPGGQAGLPVAQGRLQRGDASGGADLSDQRGDLLQQVAAPPELVGQPDVPYVGRAVDPVARLRIAARPDQPGVLPFAQGGRADA